MGGKPTRPTLKLIAQKVFYQVVRVVLAIVERFWIPLQDPYKISFRWGFWVST